MTSDSIPPLLLPWRTESYNDEELLEQLRSADLEMSWEDIQRIFNRAVPSRRRTIDELVTKWEGLTSVKPLNSQGDRAATQFENAEQLMEVKSGHHDNSSVSNQLIDSEPVQEQPWIDSLGICWEGIEDIDRYGFEYEEFQEMRRLAIEIACDNRFNQSVPKEELNTVGFSEDDVKDEK